MYNDDDDDDDDDNNNNNNKVRGRERANSSPTTAAEYNTKKTL
jgi:hypothetical protein